MAEYIELEKVLDDKNIITVLTKEYGSIEVIPVDTITDIELADVQPVIHSRWIPTGDGTYNAYCENCGQERGSKSWNKNDFKYCFGCGARMDGDTE